MTYWPIRDSWKWNNHQKTLSSYKCESASKIVTYSISWTRLMEPLTSELRYLCVVSIKAPFSHDTEKHKKNKYFGIWRDMTNNLVIRSSARHFAIYILFFLILKRAKNSIMMHFKFESLFFFNFKNEYTIITEVYISLPLSRLVQTVPHTIAKTHRWDCSNTKKKIFYNFIIY